MKFDICMSYCTESKQRSNAYLTYVPCVSYNNLWLGLHIIHRKPVRTLESLILNSLRVASSSHRTAFACIQDKSTTSMHSLPIMTIPRIFWKFDSLIRTSIVYVFVDEMHFFASDSSVEEKNKRPFSHIDDIDSSF